MKKYILLILVFSTQLTFAEDETSKSAVKFLQEINSNPPKGNIDVSCVSCQANSEKKRDMYCEDLVEAACYDDEGKHVQLGGYMQIRKELKYIVQEARDATAHALGFKDTGAFLTEEMKKNGIEFRETPEQKQWSTLLNENLDWRYSSEDEIKFSNVEKCEAEVQTFSDDKEASASLDKMNDFIKKQMVQINKYTAMNLPGFINDLNMKCSLLKPGSISINNDEIYNVCSKANNIRKEAVDLYRQEGTPAYEAKALAFAGKYNVLEFVWEETDLKEQEQTSKKIAGLCLRLKTVVNSAAKSIAKSSMEEFAKAKPTVEYLIEKNYPQYKKQKSDAYLKMAKNSISGILPDLTNDKAKIQKIKSGYSKLDVNWIKNPGISYYETGKKINLPVLKEPESDDSPYAYFMDASLDRFTTMNAFYIADSGGKEEKVHMLPAMIYMLDSNPYSYLEVLSHEAGHKIGPEVSKENGHDLSAGWKDLLKCYSEKDSIRMKKNQADETISDYISSVVLGDMLMSLPVSERRDALKGAMQASCIFDDSDNKDINVATDDVHPIGILRVGGIFGASPSIRNALGCTQPSTKYKTCGLPKAKK